MNQKIIEDIRLINLKVRLDSWLALEDCRENTIILFQKHCCNQLRKTQITLMRMGSHMFDNKIRNMKSPKKMNKTSKGRI